MHPTGHAFSRQELECMKRADIQSLCKEYGVKANMKTEALIELLLDTIHHSNMAPLVPPPRPPPPPAPAPSARRASTRSRTSSRTSSTKTRLTSTSSVVVHDEVEQDSSQHTATTLVEPPIDATAGASASRARKAKDTQLRLGMGRPAMAGGSGPRSVTRTLSVAKAGRGRASRSMVIAPKEQTIAEEQEPDHGESEAETAMRDGAPAPEPTHTLSSRQSVEPHALEKVEALLSGADFKRHFDILKDLPAQVDWLKRAVHDRDAECTALRSEIRTCREEIEVLRAETAKIPVLENQLKLMREGGTLPRPSSAIAVTPKGVVPRRVSTPLGESDLNSGSPNKTAHAASPVKPNYPGPTQTTLGKRHRDSTSSNVDGVVDMDQGDLLSEKDLARRVLRPNKKRAKLGEADGVAHNDMANAETMRHSSNEQSSEELSGHISDSAASSRPSTVPPVGTPPPSNHLPDYYGASLEESAANGNNGQVVDYSGRDAGGIDAHEGTAGLIPYPTDGCFPFSFSVAASSTPRGDEMLGYLDGPFSPGSAMKAGARGASGLLPAFGMRRVSSITRSLTRAAAEAQDGRLLYPVLGEFDEEEFTHFGQLGFGMDFPQLRPEASTAMGGGAVPAPMPLSLDARGPVAGTETPARPISKTMYGTELANDKRFGDFGRDGIASTNDRMFWMGGGGF